ncbi:MAG: hypothetical protein IKQ06_04415 [Bacilli bacterium]|nr:hypothetical protein [Bacilli bacterium]
MLGNYKKELIKVYEEARPVVARPEGNEEGKIRRVFYEDRKRNKGERFEKFHSVKNNIQNLTDEFFKGLLPKELDAEYKIGLTFNLSQQPWVFIHNDNNSRPTLSSSVFMGVNLNIDGLDKSNDNCDFESKKGYSLWIGIGITGVKQRDMYNNRISLINRMKQVIGEELENGFYFVESKEDNVGIAIRKDSRIEETFEEDLKYLSELYLKFVGSDAKCDISKNTIIKANTNSKALSYVYDNYLKHLDENSYSIVTYSPDYRLFLENISLILKMAINNPKEEYYLVINDLNAFDNSYLSEFKMMLYRNYIYSLNNVYLSRIIYKEDNRKVFLPNNLFVVFTSTLSSERKEIEETLNAINIE